MIPSHEQARKIGQQRTSGKEGEAFTVFPYKHQPSGCTLFAVRVPGEGGDLIITVGS